jgi:hypothetical protein
MTAQQVAEWMLEELRRVEYLRQQTVVEDIASRFGEEFTYINDRGNRAIRKDILDAFNELSGDSVVWERGDRLWRMRESHDELGRRQN